MYIYNTYIYINHIYIYYKPYIKYINHIYIYSTCIYIYIYRNWVFPQLWPSWGIWRCPPQRLCTLWATCTASSVSWWRCSAAVSCFCFQKQKRGKQWGIQPKFSVITWGYDGNIADIVVIKGGDIYIYMIYDDMMFECVWQWWIQLK